MKIRKQVYELIPDDLDTFPVWEFALDEEGEDNQDEATVRPSIGSEPIDPAEGMKIVKATFRLADGSTALGYITPPEDESNDLGTIQPVIVSDNGQVAFWCGVIIPSAEQLAESYNILSKQPLEIFPLAFESDVALVGGSVSGIVPGFLILEDWESGKTRTVT